MNDAQTLAEIVRAARTRIPCKKHFMPREVGGHCAICLLEQRTGGEFVSIATIMGRW